MKARAQHERCSVHHSRVATQVMYSYYYHSSRYDVMQLQAMAVFNSAAQNVLRTGEKLLKMISTSESKLMQHYFIYLEKTSICS